MIQLWSVLSSDLFGGWSLEKNNTLFQQTLREGRRTKDECCLLRPLDSANGRRFSFTCPRVVSLCVRQVATKPVRVNRHVLERQNWEKFGDCRGLPRGPEQNITYQSFEIIHVDLRPKKREEEKDDGALESKLSGTSSIVVCRSTYNSAHRAQRIVGWLSCRAALDASPPLIRLACVSLCACRLR
jgi:hypothetical protein